MDLPDAAAFATDAEELEALLVSLTEMIDIPSTAWQRQSGPDHRWQLQVDQNVIEVCYEPAPAEALAQLPQMLQDMPQRGSMLPEGFERKAALALGHIELRCGAQRPIFVPIELGYRPQGGRRLAIYQASDPQRQRSLRKAFADLVAGQRLDRSAELSQVAATLRRLRAHTPSWLGGRERPSAAIEF